MKWGETTPPPPPPHLNFFLSILTIARSVPWYSPVVMFSVDNTKATCPAGREASNSRARSSAISPAEQPMPPSE